VKKKSNDTSGEHLDQQCNWCLRYCIAFLYARHPVSSRASPGVENLFFYSMLISVW